MTNVYNETNTETITDTIPQISTEIIENNFTSVDTVTESVTMVSITSVTEISKVFDVAFSFYAPIIGIFNIYLMKRKRNN